MADEAVDTGAEEGAQEGAGEGGSSLLTGAEGADQGAEGKVEESAVGEGKEGEGQGEDKKGEGEEAKPNAPEAYDFKLPEGFEGELNQDAIGEFEPIARELDLNQEQAQKLVDIYTRQSQAAHQKQIEQYRETQEQWVKDLKSDAEFGGAKFDANIKHAQRAIQEFGNDGIKSLLDQSGLGNNPDVVKMFAVIGKRMAEDSPGQGTERSSQREVPLEERLYPNMYPKK
ncbi:peptidase [Salinicola corii]|uniref:Peptidase n=1 Tax=Salinicola corii TaxID=2606937 RepID=A0A640WJC7_9GAMM|nr:peptidase [Salinicola corii]KAA0020728.1 peptidase [Salinicola corii]